MLVGVNVCARGRAAARADVAPPFAPPRRSLVALARALAAWLSFALLAAGALQAAANEKNPPQPASLAERLDAVLARPALRGAALSVLVVDRRSGQLLYARAPDRVLIPASNLKVLTAVAALRWFGPTHRFTTSVLAPDGLGPEGSVGWLAVRGGGDPGLTSEQWWRLAADLRARGLRRVQGDLIVDESVFDAEHWRADWSPLTARAYHAPVAGLSANYGAFRVVVEPGPEPGAPLEVRVDPPLSYFQVVAEGATGGPDALRRVRVERASRPSGDRIRVTGTLPVGGEPVELYRSVSHPARYAGAVWRMQLEALGIAVEGEVRPGRIPAGATPLLSFEGRDLATLTRLFLKNSNNMMAEMLVKAMARAPDEAADAGPPGTWSAGLQRMHQMLEQLGIASGALVLADGSGLSRDNRVTARQLVAALRVADASFDFGPELLAALPIAAADGTLERRADGAAGGVRAKTGLLSGVTGLSGFAHSQGREMVFSALANAYAGDDRAAMDALDAFAAALVAGPASGP